MSPTQTIGLFDSTFWWIQDPWALISSAVPKVGNKAHQPGKLLFSSKIATAVKMHPSPKQLK